VQSIGTGEVEVTPGDYFELIAQTSASINNIADDETVRPATTLRSGRANQGPSAWLSEHRSERALSLAQQGR
jgi:hypothetical protein